ncbi:glycosyltransferase family 2 protein [Mycobacterium tuberculosis]|uniref:glycosyltransferase family 2 protein n=1 Tax=Mycobacterium tuberculosis TaxID=1773 RepID=UPI0005E62EFE|nr:glycosyltransferase [Mycobacterium tuberculosis]CKL96631.1 glycosyl transferase family protein [Mycobacterium tuberculosis]
MVPGDASSVVSVNPAKPLISVCIPMYNNGATIERCLRSILEQEGVEFEIVVVDDDSSDDCAAIAATMLRPGDRLLRNEPRLGLNRNHNKCLEVARGGLIQFVHGDDRLLPGALQTLSRRFEDPSVGMAFAPRRVESDDIKWQQRYGRGHTRFRQLRDRNHGPSLVLQMVLHGAKENWIGEPTAVMFRRQLALDAGGFRTDIYQLVDVDFWLRLMLRSAVCFVPHELSVRRHTAATETTRVMATRRNVLDRQRILTWLIVDPLSPNSVRSAAALWWIPAWLAMIVEVAVLGPQRRTHLKALAPAPFREFAHARRQLPMAD